MIDLLETDGDDLYFTDPLSPEVEGLMESASEAYAQGDAELPLLRAYLLSDSHLTVLVGLYRFYYYQHRLKEAQQVALRSMSKASLSLGFNKPWSELSSKDFLIDDQTEISVALIRFYLLALKGFGYLCVRLHEFEQGTAALKKVYELDEQDHLGAKALLDTILTSEEYRRYLSDNNMPIPLKAY